MQENTVLTVGVLGWDCCTLVGIVVKWKVLGLTNLLTCWLCEYFLEMQVKFVDWCRFKIYSTLGIWEY